VDPGAAIEVRGWFSREYEPLASVDPGEPVVFRAHNARWKWDPDDVTDPPEGAGHALEGPFEVRGAGPGQTLVVHVDEVVPRAWGETWANGERFVWRLEGDTWHLGRRRVHAAPFLGVIGMPPPEPGEHSTIPPRRFGGNIDCRELVAGSELWLPVPVDGALLMAGDGHGAQGDGEVSGTAIECPLERVQLRFELRDVDLRSPVARIPVGSGGGAWLAFGFDEDLDLAADQARETMLDLMERELRLSRNEALALASVGVDLRVTQIVNGAKGVHAVLRDGAFR
jgi:acetamidase/formamidase